MTNPTFTAEEIATTLAEDRYIMDGAERVGQYRLRRAHHIIAQLQAQNEKMRAALKQLADNQLSEDNCASVDVAARRVRNIASAAIKDN